MVRYFAKRLGMMLVALFMIMLLTFSIMHAVPGGPFTSDRNMSELPECKSSGTLSYEMYYFYGGLRGYGL